jgi:hypothetical protein
MDFTLPINDGEFLAQRVGPDGDECFISWTTNPNNVTSFVNSLNRCGRAEKVRATVGFSDTMDLEEPTMNDALAELRRDLPSMMLKVSTAIPIHVRVPANITDEALEDLRILATGHTLIFEHTDITLE